MQVGTALNLCDQRPADSRAANGVETLHQNWNSLIKKARLSSLARNVGDPPAEVA